MVFLYAIDRRSRSGCHPRTDCRPSCISSTYALTSDPAGVLQSTDRPITQPPSIPQGSLELQYDYNIPRNNSYIGLWPRNIQYQWTWQWSSGKSHHDGRRSSSSNNEAVGSDRGQSAVILKPVLFLSLFCWSYWPGVVALESP